jgi:hypothetical protein
MVLHLIVFMIARNEKGCQMNDVDEGGLSLSQCMSRTWLRTSLTRTFHKSCCDIQVRLAATAMERSFLRTSPETPARRYDGHSRILGRFGHCWFAATEC